MKSLDEDSVKLDESSPLPWRLGLLFAVEVIALTIWSTPGERFTRFAYGDSGTDLTIQNLLARGFLPTLDFGYIYGLLPLLINKLWQGIFGANPGACRAAALACNLATAWGIARFASTMRTGRAGIALILFAMPDILLTSTFVLVHVLEQALLINALAFQARGKRGVSLALATACLFVKPSMAYLYGLMLVAVIARTDLRNGRRVLAPAVITGLILGSILAVIYGLVPLLTTLTPGAGIEVYRQSRHGFFQGVGKEFWYIPGGGLRDYFRYEVGSWMIGTFLLTTGGLLALVRVVRNRAARNDELVLTCSMQHIAFILVFFGNRWTWVYYYATMILGLAAIAARGRRHAAIIGVLALLVLAGGKAKFETTARLWRTDSSSAETFNLWASPAERADWLNVLELSKRHHPVVLLAETEGAALLTPGVFEAPAGSYFVPGHPVPSEIRRKAKQIARAETIVIARPKSDPGRGGYDAWPEIAAEFAGFEIISQGALFRVERRIHRPADSPGRIPDSSRHTKPLPLASQGDCARLTYNEEAVL